MIHGLLIYLLIEPFDRYQFFQFRNRELGCGKTILIFSKDERETRRILTFRDQPLLGGYFHVFNPTVNEIQQNQLVISTNDLLLPASNLKDNFFSEFPSLNSKFGFEMMRICVSNMMILHPEIVEVCGSPLCGGGHVVEKSDLCVSSLFAPKHIGRLALKAIVEIGRVDSCDSACRFAILSTEMAELFFHPNFLSNASNLELVGMKVGHNLEFFINRMVYMFQHEKTQSGITKGIKFIFSGYYWNPKSSVNEAVGQRNAQCTLFATEPPLSHFPETLNQRVSAFVQSGQNTPIEAQPLSEYHTRSQPSRQPIGSNSMFSVDRQDCVVC